MNDIENKLSTFTAATNETIPDGAGSGEADPMVEMLLEQVRGTRMLALATSYAIVLVAAYCAAGTVLHPAVHCALQATALCACCGRTAASLTFR
jgi:hypothetical protein